MGAEDEGVTDQEERMINEEYKIWKKNTPFLYGAAPAPHRTPRGARSGALNFERALRLQIW
jgi:hypothetical protein